MKHGMARAAFAAVLAAPLVAAGPAVAQRIPVVLVHGFRSDPGAWVTTAPFLEANGNYTTYTVGAVRWFDPISTQTSALNGFLTGQGFGPSAVLVGHSQGGVVSRLASRTNAVRGIVTIGSPHGGAPIANSHTYLTAEIALISSDYFIATANLADEDVCDPFDDPICSDSFDALQWVIPATDGVLITLELYLAYHANDLPDLAPGSVTITGLQNAYGLEQSGTRVYVDSDVLDYDAGPFRLIESQPAADQDASVMSTSGLAIALDGLGIVFNDDPTTDANYLAHQAAGYALMEIGGEIAGMSYVWNYIIVGGVPSDGVIPTSRQSMPNATEKPIFGVAHTEEVLQALTILNQLDFVTRP